MSGQDINPFANPEDVNPFAVRFLFFLLFYFYFIFFCLAKQAGSTYLSTIK